MGRLKEMYDRSWLGEQTGSTRGRTLLVNGAVLLLCVAVPWLYVDAARQERESIAERQATEEKARDVSEYLTCLRSVESGRELQATAIAGVEHAEATAALWTSVVDILKAANPDSPLVIQISHEVEAYIQGVAEYRRVAEAYQPPRLASCGDPP